MKQISVRQICLLFIAFVPVTKVIILPSVLVSFAEQQSWLAALLSFLAEAGVIAALMWLARSYDGTFFDLLSANFGKTVARAVYTLYALYFTVKTCALVVEQRSFVETVLYETTPTILNFLPFFFVALFICMQSIKAVGRMADVCFWATLNGFGLILALTLINLHFDAVFPLFYGSFPKVFRGSLASLMWFGEASYLLFFMGKIKWSRRATLKAVGAYAGGALIVLVFLVSFICLFEGTAVRNVYAVARTAKYSISLSNIGRLDFLAIFALLAVEIVALSVPLLLATECLTTAFPVKRRLYPAAAVVLLPLLTQLFLGPFFDTLIRLNTGPVAWFYLAMGTVLPLAACLLPKKRAGTGEGQPAPDARKRKRTGKRTKEKEKNAS